MSTGSGTGTPLTSAANAYATLADLRASPELKLAGGETADDTLLTALLESVARLIDQRTQRTFAAAADTTRYFDARRDVILTDRTYTNSPYGNYGGYALTLQLNDDLAQITSITNGDGVAIATNEYVTEPRNVLSVDNGNYAPIWAIRLKWSSGKFWTWTTDYENSIAVTGRWAYSVTAPEVVKRANILGAAALYRNALTNDADRAIVAGGGIIIQPAQLPKVFYMLVDPLVRKV